MAKELQTLRDVIDFLYLAACDRFDWDRTAKKGELICWRIENDGMVGPRAFRVTEYRKGTIRLKNAEGRMIKKVWPFGVPEQKRFELSMLISEISEDFTGQFFDFVDSSFRSFQDVPSLNLFEGDSGYPGYAWTKKAHSIEEKIAEENQQRKIRLAQLRKPSGA